MVLMVLNKASTSGQTHQIKHIKCANNKGGYNEKDVCVG